MSGVGSSWRLDRLLRVVDQQAKEVLKINWNHASVGSPSFWLPVDSKSTHPMSEPVLIQDRFISFLVTRLV